MSLANLKIFWTCFLTAVVLTAFYGYEVSYSSEAFKHAKQDNSARIIISEFIDDIIPYPQSELAKGMTYGDDDNIPKDIKDRFRQLGITHILAVSGSNVAIIIGIFSSFALYLLGRKISLILIVVLLCSFISITGFEPSIIRASIMALCGLMGTYFGRSSQGLYLLLFTAGIMIFFEPKIAFSSLGFQLSFLATFGIVGVYPFLKKKINYEKYGNKVTTSFLDSILLTLSAQIATLFVVLPKFGLPSILSVPANVFIAPMSAIVMLLTLITLISSTLSYFLTNFFAFLTYSVINIMLFISEILI